MRTYNWRLRVRSYEGDAWGRVPASGILRYMEQSAILAAADAGYGNDFHREHNSAWVVHRATISLPIPLRLGAEVEITTWISHFSRVRGGREYIFKDAATGETLGVALTEWVYVDRTTLQPKAIPRELAVDFATLGGIQQQYDPPTLEPNMNVGFATERTVEWHEIDSMGHVNNAVYADWLDDAFRNALNQAGWDVKALRESGLHLRGEYYNLSYKRGALPGEQVRIATTIEAISGRLCGIRQTITGADGTEMHTAYSVQSWRDNTGAPTEPPEGWGLAAVIGDR